LCRKTGNKWLEHLTACTIWNESELNIIGCSAGDSGSSSGLPEFYLNLANLNSEGYTPKSDLRFPMKLQVRVLLIFLILAALGAICFQLERSPSIFANATYLGAIVALEVVLACLWKFEKVFLPVTMLCFIVAGTGLPLAGASNYLRWLFLTVGGLAGVVLWMKSNREKHFEVFHLVALFCILTALATASASNSPVTAALKVGSLLLLFLYASTGARVALAGREDAFVRGMVLGCEIMVYIAAVCNFVLGYDLFGSPNALGAVIGVGVAPVLLWSALMAQDHAERRRRYIALALCGILLYVTVCRAAIVADTFLVIFITIGLRRPGLLVKGIFAAALFLEIMAVSNPSHMGELLDTMTGRFIYKLDRSQNHLGVFGSRQTPWEDSVNAIKQHPWFGTGFGTSDLGSDRTDIQYSSIYTRAGSNREHGSSYLALAEYVGLLGIVPFVILLVLLMRAATRAYSWMHRNQSPKNYAVVFAMIVVAGLIHAGFEDWLFAAGSYLSVFFWVAAFLLIDLASQLKTDLRVAVPRPFVAFSPVQTFRQPTT
jgi:O-antigen ligase